MKKLITIFFLMATINSQAQYKTIGSIERIDPDLDKIVSPNAKIEVIAEGFDWSEGPVWIEKYKDIPIQKN